MAELIEKHERSIRQLIHLRSGTHVLRKASADDIFQETVTIALASARRFVFQDDESFLAWISTIARRVIARTFATPAQTGSTVRIRRAESSGAGVPEDELSSGGRTPSSVAAAHERQDDLRAAIGRLPPHYRRVLILYRIEERSLAEVAALMGRTKGATCRLIARAMNKLRRQLDES